MPWWNFLFFLVVLQRFCWQYSWLTPCPLYTSYVINLPAYLYNTGLMWWLKMAAYRFWKFTCHFETMLFHIVQNINGRENDTLLAISEYCITLLFFPFINSLLWKLEGLKRSMCINEVLLSIESFILYCFSWYQNLFLATFISSLMCISSPKMS